LKGFLLSFFVIGKEFAVTLLIDHYTSCMCGGNGMQIFEKVQFCKKKSVKKMCVVISEYIMYICICTLLCLDIFTFGLQLFVGGFCQCNVQR